MSENAAPAMDYAEHERTYSGFVAFFKISLITSINIVLCLLIFGFGGSYANLAGGLVLFAAMVAAVIGLFSGERGWVPTAIAFVFAVFMAILNVA